MGSQFRPVFKELRPNERSCHACLVACDKAGDVQWSRALWLFNGNWDGILEPVTRCYKVKAHNLVNPRVYGGSKSIANGFTYQLITVHLVRWMFYVAFYVAGA